MHFTLRWLGNAGFEFKLGTQTLLIDPFFTRPQLLNAYFGQVSLDIRAIDEHLQGCDHVLISHTHFDHFMDVPQVAHKSGAVVYGSANTCALARAQGIPEKKIRMIRSGDKVSLGEISIEILPAAHPWLPGYGRGKLNGRVTAPMRLRDYRMDECFSFLIAYQSKRLLVWSSTKTRDAVAGDLVICRAVSPQSWYERIMAAAQPSIVIPSHWDDMFLPLSKPVQPFLATPRLAWPPLERINLGEFERKVLKARPHCRVMVPERFKRYEINL